MSNPLGHYASKLRPGELTRSMVAKRLGISPSEINEAIRRGLLRPFEVPIQTQGKNTLHARVYRIIHEADLPAIAAAISPIDLWGHQRINAIADDRRTPEDIVIDADTLKRLWNNSGLTDAERSVVCLFYGLGGGRPLRAGEIAKARGVTSSAVYFTLSRALDKLRKCAERGLEKESKPIPPTAEPTDKKPVYIREAPIYIYQPPIEIAIPTAPDGEFVMDSEAEAAYRIIRGEERIHYWRKVPDKLIRKVLEIIAYELDRKPVWGLSSVDVFNIKGLEGYIYRLGRGSFPKGKTKLLKRLNIPRPTLQEGLQHLYSSTAKHFQWQMLSDDLAAFMLALAALNHGCGITDVKEAWLGFSLTQSGRSRHVKLGLLFRRHAGRIYSRLQTGAIFRSGVRNVLKRFLADGRYQFNLAGIILSPTLPPHPDSLRIERAVNAPAAKSP